jgi:hypothetical protein
MLSDIISIAIILMMKNRRSTSPEMGSLVQAQKRKQMQMQTMCTETDSDSDSDSILIKIERKQNGCISSSQSD